MNTHLTENNSKCQTWVRKIPDTVMEVTFTLTNNSISPLHRNWRLLVSCATTEQAENAGAIFNVPLAAEIPVSLVRDFEYGDVHILGDVLHYIFTGEIRESLKKASCETPAG